MDTEAVLLINDYQAELRKLHFVLKQRMGTNDQLCRTLLDIQ